MAARALAVAAAAATILAGCGGSSDPPVPPSDAGRLVERADLLAAALEREQFREDDDDAPCASPRARDALLEAIDAAPELPDEIAQLADEVARRVACPPRDFTVSVDAWELARSLREHTSDPHDLRVSNRAVRPDDDVFARALTALGPVFAADYAGRGLDDATHGQRALHALWIVDGEVNNGGFQQFFDNTEGRLNEEAVEGAQLFGASRHRDVIADAVAAKSEGRELGAFDERWYDLGALDPFIARYMRAHRDEFFRDW